MSDCIQTVSDFDNVQESVCVSVRKIMDACRDQDCTEHVPVYLTADSQAILENATSVKARTAELLYTGVDVEPVPYQDGYFTVNIQYYYRVIADAVTCGVRPATIYGLASTCTQAMLFGGEGQARSFTSGGGPATAQPVGVVEAVDPVILSARIASEEDCACCLGALPEPVAAAFDDAPVFGQVENRLQVTLGQFSLVRLERDTQLLIPSLDYCIPSKACTAGVCGCPENPCETFARMQFPVSAFFPTEEDRELCREDCGCCGTENDGGCQGTESGSGTGSGSRRR